MISSDFTFFPSLQVRNFWVSLEFLKRLVVVVVVWFGRDWFQGQGFRALPAFLSPLPATLAEKKQGVGRAGQGCWLPKLCLCV